MKKVKATLPEQKWASLNTKYRPSSIQMANDQFSAGSKNFQTNIRGVVTKRPGGINYNPSTFTGAPKDQYEAVFSDGTRHMLVMHNGTLSYSSGGGTFADVTSGYSSIGNMEFALYLDRVYFDNGIDSPQVYDRTVSYGGVTYTPPKTKAMGAQVPGSAPTAAEGSGGNIAAGSYFYQVTFLYYGFEESNGGPASTVLTLATPPSRINLTAIPTGGYGVTARKIYRSGDAGASYRLVGTISDNTTTTFTDNLAVGTSLIPLDNGLPPTFSYIIQSKDTNWVAGVPGNPSKLYYSAAGLPDIFNAAGFILCNPRDPITGLFVFNDRIIVFNRSSFGQILGTTPDTYTYSEFPGTIGCVDNRTIQVRVGRGLYGYGNVPVLTWLSAKGFYQFNGASIDYASDLIEDQVNFNIQQALQIKGQNAQATQAAFQAGTPSAGIDLITFPGKITTKNPKRLWQLESDWEGGASFPNVATHTPNVMTVPVKFAPALSAGTLTPTAIISSNTLTLSQGANSTGESTSQTSNSSSYVSPLAFPTSYRFYQKFTQSRSGTVTSGTIYAKLFSTGAGSQTSTPVSISVYTDNAGSPGTAVSTGAATAQVNGVMSPITAALSASLTGGLNYWLLLSVPILTNVATQVGLSSGSFSTATPAYVDGSGPLGFPQTVLATAIAGSYVYAQSVVSGAGQWLSPVDDTASSTVDGTLTYTHTGTYPASTSAQTSLEASPDNTTWTLLKTTNNLNGSDTVSVVAASGYRYFRLRLQPATTDDRSVPVLGPPTLAFTTTGVWTSETIDCTTDVSAYVGLTAVTTTPAGTSVTLQAASSTDNITFSAFASLGATPLRRYIKFKVTMTTTGDNLTSPTVTSLLFTYTILANLVSSVIDTGTTPAGWDVFQAVSAANGGTILMELKSASAPGGLGAATYFTVTNGAFPTTPVNRYAQWRVTLTSNADMVPQVSSVTVNWFISLVSSIRAASLFYNRSYYVSLAEFGQTTNNVVFELDFENNWRVHRGVNAATLGLFFTDPYYGSSTVGQIVRWLTTFTDQGTNIEMDIRTKALDFGDASVRKALRRLYVTGLSTGATYTPQYSVDAGVTFQPLVDELGNQTFTTASDNSLFTKRLAPLGANNYSGKTIMFRLDTNDANTAELHELEAEVYVRQADVVNS